VPAPDQIGPRGSDDGNHGDVLARPGDANTELRLHLGRRGDDRRADLHCALSARRPQRACAAACRRPARRSADGDPVYRGLAGTMTWRSFHAAATWIYSEGDQPLRRVRYKERPEGLFLGSGDGENAFHRPPDDIVVIPGPEPLKTGRRRCVSCEVDFPPARPWSRFCSPACRLRAHRRLAGSTKGTRSAAALVD
jgi:hypothetical protein